MIKINGCNRLGQSDGNDWITDCEAQGPVHNLTEEAKEMIQQTAGLTPTDPTIVPVLKASATVHGIAWDDVDGDKVKDPAEAVIPGASMRLIGTYNYGPINRLSDGFYSFTAIPSNYTLRCTANGFVTQNRSISLTTDETETQDFGMRR